MNTKPLIVPGWTVPGFTVPEEIAREFAEQERKAAREYALSNGCRDILPREKTVWILKRIALINGELAPAIEGLITTAEARDLSPEQFMYQMHGQSYSNMTEYNTAMTILMIMNQILMSGNVPEFVHEGNGASEDRCCNN